MSIASPIVPNPSQAVAAARVALTEALVLKVGQVLQALVVGKSADGLTALKIGDQVVTATLPQMNLLPGSTLQLQVKVAGATPQLQVIATPTATVPAAAHAPVGSVVPVQTRPESVAATERPSVPTQPPPNAVPPTAKAESQQGGTPLRVESDSRPISPAAAVSRPASVAVENPPVHPASTPPMPVRVADAVSPPKATPTPAVPSSGVSTTEPVSTPSVTVPGPVQLAPQWRPARAPASVGQPAGTPPSAGDGRQTSPVAPAVIHRPTGPVVPAPSAPSASVSAEAGAPAVTNSLLVAQSAPRPQASIADLPRSVTASPATVPPALAQQAVAPQSPPPPATPQTALAQMLPEALSRQDSAGPLLVSLAAAIQRPGLLPDPILRAALGVLAQRIVVSDGKVQPGQLEQAMTRSGVTLEASLLRTDPQPRDAKAGLLALREALGKWLGGSPAPLATGRDPAPPPIKGLPLRAVMAEAPPPLPDTAREAGRLLHSEADAAVSRVKLMQLASLPDSDPGKPAASTVRMELPFLIGHELVMAQIQVGRDGARREAERKRGWTMRFALNFSATGEVGAEVGVLGKAVNVSLWAVEPETAAVMAGSLQDLTRALEGIGLKPGAVRIRQGAPTDVHPPPSGRLLDSVS